MPVLMLINFCCLQHLVDHIGSSEIKPKEILQSNFDLLGELMKFNPIAFKIFNSVIDDKKVGVHNPTIFLAHVLT